MSRPGCIGLAVSKLAGAEFSIAAHARDIYVESGALAVKAQKAKFIVCCSAGGQKYLRQKLKTKLRNKVFLNYHGIEIPSVVAKNKTDDLKILAVGRLVRKKGFEYFIRAMAIVAKTRPTVKAGIIGSGYQERKLKELAAGLGLTKQVCFWGAKDHSETLEAIRQADIVVAPSVIDNDGDRDGIANVVLEAFAGRCAVISTDLDAMREVVKDGETGLIVAAEQVQELADAILRLIDDARLRGYLADNAYRFVKEYFDINKNVRKLIEIFQEEKICHKKIRIVHVLEGFAGGAATYIDNTLVRLSDIGFDVTFICSLGRGEDGNEECIEKLRRHGIKVHIVDMQREIKPLSDIRAFLAILKIFRKNRFDILHSHCSKAGALGRVAAMIAGIKVRIHSPHCFAFVRCGGVLSKWFYLVLEKILGVVTTKLILVGKAEKEVAKIYKIASADKCEVVQNGLDIETSQLTDAKKAAYKNQLGIESKCRVIGAVCRLVSYKGVEKFIESASLCKAKDVVFVIAGEGQLRCQIEKIIAGKNLNGKVLLLGHIPDMQLLYGICDAVVLCSQAEGQSYVILEAMRSRCPVVASSVMGNIELLDEGRGILVENRAEHIAAGIDSVLSDKQNCQQMRERAYQYFIKHHNIERQIDELGLIYESAVKGGKS